MYNRSLYPQRAFSHHSDERSNIRVNTTSRKKFRATCCLMLAKCFQKPNTTTNTPCLLTLSALFCTICCNTSQALEKQLPYHMSPVAMLTGDLEVETSVNINKSLSIGPLYTNKDYEFSGENLNILGYGIRAEWRFLGTRSSGVYLSPFAKVWSFGFHAKNNDESFPSTSSSVDTTTYGALLGYQWMARSFSMNTGIGWAASNNHNSELRFTKQQHLASESQTQTNSFLIDLAVGWNF